MKNENNIAILTPGLLKATCTSRAFNIFIFIFIFISHAPLCADTVIVESSGQENSDWIEVPAGKTIWLDVSVAETSSYTRTNYLIDDGLRKPFWLSCGNGDMIRLKGPLKVSFDVYDARLVADYQLVGQDDRAEQMIIPGSSGTVYSQPIEVAEGEVLETFFLDWFTFTDWGFAIAEVQQGKETCRVRLKKNHASVVFRGPANIRFGVSGASTWVDGGMVAGYRIVPLTTSDADTVLLTTGWGEPGKASDPINVPDGQTLQVLFCGWDAAGYTNPTYTVIRDGSEQSFNLISQEFSDISGPCSIKLALGYGGGGAIALTYRLKPTSAISELPALELTALSGEHCLLCFETRPAQSYWLQGSSDLNNWIPISQFSGDSRKIEMLLSLSGAKSTFWRLSLSASEENLPPVARIAYTKHVTILPGTGIKMCTLYLDASGSHDPEGGNLRYFWRTADGSDYSEGEAKTSKVIASARRVYLKVEDEVGNEDVTSVFVSF